MHSYLERNEDSGYLRVWLWYRFFFFVGVFKLWPRVFSWSDANVATQAYLASGRERDHTRSEPVCSQAALSHSSYLLLVMLIISWHLLWVSTLINRTWELFWQYLPASKAREYSAAMSLSRHMLWSKTEGGFCCSCCLFCQFCSTSNNSSQFYIWMQAQNLPAEVQKEEWWRSRATNFCWSIRFW